MVNKKKNHSMYQQRWTVFSQCFSPTVLTKILKFAGLEQQFSKQHLILLVLAGINLPRGVYLGLKEITSG